MDLGDSSCSVEKISHKASSAMVVIVASPTRGSSQPYIGGWASVPKSG